VIVAMVMRYFRREDSQIPVGVYQSALHRYATTNSAHNLDDFAAQHYNYTHVHFCLPPAGVIRATQHCGAVYFGPKKNTRSFVGVRARGCVGGA
jgi:hypothetical protein